MLDPKLISIHKFVSTMKQDEAMIWNASSTTIWYLLVICCCCHSIPSGR